MTPQFTFRSFIIVILFTTLSLQSIAQTPPPCDASTPQLRFFAAEDTFSFFLNISLLPIDNPDARSLAYAFNGEIDIIEDTIALESNPLFLEFPYAKPSDFSFTAIDTCEDGSVHLGGTFFIEIPGGDTISLECPIPTGLEIDNLIYTEVQQQIQFSWSPTSQAILYHANYFIGGTLQAQQELSTPNFTFQLDPNTAVHEFEIYNICDTLAFSPLPFLRSPSIKFSIVTLDDVKGLVCNDLDSLKPVRALRYLCNSPEDGHGNFGPNRDRFFNFHDTLCLPGPDNVEEIYIQQHLDISITPNPAKDIINIQIQSEIPISIRPSITDIYGKRLILLEDAYAHGRYFDFSFEVEALPTGLYLLQFDTPLGSFAKKVVISP